MIDTKKIENHYDRAIELEKGIYWIGYYDKLSGLHCNPYLIIDSDEAVVIDGGSRPDFPTVMMKILQTGIDPQQITALIYQHYDPDLCGSVPNFEDIIKRKDLSIITDEHNTAFITHYAVASRLLTLEDIKSQYEFSSGRTLRFIKTPYAHSAGSFVTFDTKSKILFSSDLFGSDGSEWELFLRLMPECMKCKDYSECIKGEASCQITDILKYHQRIMPSERALKHAIERILEMPFTMIAPQHGSIIDDKDLMKFVFKLLISLRDVGLDGVIGDDYIFDFNNIDERF